MAVKLREGRAAAGELLHDEALAAEDAGPYLLLEEHGQLHPRLAGQEAALLDDQLPAGGDVEGRMLPGKLDAKAIMPGPPWAV